MGGLERGSLGGCRLSLDLGSAFRGGPTLLVSGDLLPRGAGHRTHTRRSQGQDIGFSPQERQPLAVKGDALCPASSMLSEALEGPWLDTHAPSCLISHLVPRAGRFLEAGVGKAPFGSQQIGAGEGPGGREGLSVQRGPGWSRCRGGGTGA